jgi:hypothetical protein
LAQKKGRRERKKEVVHFARDPNYFKAYSTNVVSRLTDTDVRIEFMNEKLQNGSHTTYVTDAGLILTHQAAKILSLQLGALLSEYEKKAGEIPVDKKRLAVQKKLDVLVAGIS